MFVGCYESFGADNGTYNANLTRNDCIKTCVESGNEFAGFEVKPILFFLIFKPGTIELEKFKQSSRVEI